MNSQATPLKTFTLSLCLVLLGLLTWVSAAGGVLTPSEVVQLWIQVYPHDLKTAARLTTAKLRKGQSPEEWIRQTESALKDLGFHYLGGKVTSEEVTGGQAIVIFHAQISTVIGEQIQEEQYHLRKQADGGWLIDGIDVGQEHFLGRTM